MPLILVGIHINKSVEEVNKEIEFCGRSIYFKSNLLKVFDTDNMTVYDLSFKDIVKYDYNIDLFNRTASDVGDFVEVNDLGFSSSYTKEQISSFQLPLICNDGLADSIRFVGFITSIGSFSLYVDVVKDSIHLICGNRGNIDLLSNNNRTEVTSDNSTICSELVGKLGCDNWVVPMNSYSYAISHTNTIYINLSNCSEDLILIPKGTFNILICWQNIKNLSIVIPVGITSFFITNFYLNYYEHFKYNQLDPSDYPTLDVHVVYVTFIVSNSDTKFLELLISALCEHIGVYKGVMPLDSSRFSDKDYVISNLKDLFSVLIEFY